MHFCAANHEMKRMQQGQMQKYQTSQIDFMLMKI